MYVNHVQDTKSLVIFLSWSMGLFVLRWGVCGGMNRGGYSSTQGSKISKPEGCREDGEGGCSGRVSGLVGVGFCSSSSTRIPWKDHRVGWFVTALSSPFWLVTASEQMLELQQGVRMIPAPHSHTAGQSHSTSNSHTQPAVAEAHRLTTHTHCSLGWLSKTDAHLTLFTSACLHQRWTLMLPPKTMFAPEMYYGC